MNQVEKIKNRTAIVLGILIIANFMGNVITLIFPFSGVFAAINLVSVILVISINKFKIHRFHLPFIVAIFILLQVLAGNYIVGSEQSSSFFLCYLMVGIPCLFVSLFDVNYKTVFKTIVVCSFLAIPYYIYLQGIEYTVYNAGLQMGLAYSILPGIMSSLLLFFSKENTKWKTISLITAVVGILTLLKFMTRGAYLCLFVFVISFILLKQQGSANRKLKYLLIFILGIAVVLALADTIISSIWFVNTFGYKTGNVLNGRENDIRLIFSWRGFWEFLFGSGVGSLFKITGYEYIHNVFGQVYYESGIVCTIVLLLVIIRAILMIRYKSKISIEEKELMILLLSAGIMRLMVSYYFWIEQLFWILFWRTIVLIEKRTSPAVLMETQ